MKNSLAKQLQEKMDELDRRMNDARQSTGKYLKKPKISANNKNKNISN